ncbi:putative GCN5-like protein [Trypanosoma theileri]|uniref:Biogenesis of lysosome-related organelles complex 1 subunit 1 n=1 Tax=Trypanosoma theileri TaxID=67003 RepID=A0A1X0NNM2_9TRYP|nr:putative GCN5-like protein [Trypanosoma theileri]ORC85749.1 putative GCN5-like protein [Trypanosoma theileri]
MSADNESEKAKPLILISTTTTTTIRDEGLPIPQSEHPSQFSTTAEKTPDTPPSINNNNNNNNNNNKSEERSNFLPQKLLSSLPFFSSPPATATTTQSSLTQSSSLTLSSQLADLLRAHKERQSELHAAGQQAWEDVRHYSHTACDAIAASANAEVSAAFRREKQIEAELKEIAARSAQLQRRMTAWAALFAKLNVELKEMGDVANWARRTEEDLTATVHVLEELSERKRRALGMQ